MIAWVLGIFAKWLQGHRWACTWALIAAAVFRGPGRCAHLLSWPPNHLLRGSTSPACVRIPSAQAAEITLWFHVPNIRFQGSTATHPKPATTSSPQTITSYRHRLSNSYESWHSFGPLHVQMVVFALPKLKFCRMALLLYSLGLQTPATTKWSKNN